MKNIIAHLQQKMTTYLKGAFVLCALFSNLSLKAENTSNELFAFHVIPKAGTHLINKLMPKLTGRSVRQFGGDPRNGFLLREIKRAHQENKVISIFTFYNAQVVSELNNEGVKLVAMIRDPRDALVSMLFYMRKYAGTSPFRDFFRVDNDFDSLSLDDQLMSLMKPRNGGISYLQYFNSRVGWALQPEYLAVKYEALVGNNGGGNDSEQLDTLFQIIDYLGLDLSGEKLQQIASGIYVKSGKEITVEGKTFTPAQIGNWRVFFNEQHKAVFKERLGQLLVDLGYEKNLAW